MIVTLIKKDRIYTLHLPPTIKGQFWVSDKDRQKQVRKLLSIEGVSEKWFLRSCRSTRITDESGAEIKFAEMKPSTFYRILPAKTKEAAMLFCEEITEGRLNFKKFVINTTESVSITIGRNPENTIVFNNKFVGRVHCTLMYKAGSWSIQDNRSENGTFVNDYSVSSTSLKPGDSIYVLGLTIIIGSNFIAVNNPNDNVALNSKTFKPYRPEMSDVATLDNYSNQHDNEVEYFYRTPRFKRELEKASFNIDPPPQTPVGEEMPLLLTIGPSITMGMMAMMTGGFAVMNAITTGNMMMAIPAIAMSVIMLLGTILWPTLSRRFQKRKAQAREIERQFKYKDYLEKVEEQIRDECAKQEMILKESFVSVAECVRRVVEKDISLWERSAGQSDFLSLRVGVGDEDLFAEIKVPEKKFSLDEDALLSEVINIGSKPKKLRNVPILTSLYDNYFTAVIGDRGKCIDFANGLIIQLTAYYGYDDVKIVFIHDEMEASEFGYAKWLPHVWSDDRSLRMIATNLNELKEVSAHLEKEIETRKELGSFGKEEAAPYYVVFAFSLDLALRSEMLNQLYALERNINISVVSFFDELKNVPKECTSIIELSALNGKIFDKNDTSGKCMEFVNDLTYAGNMREYSINLANIFLDISSSSYQLPNMITFMDMFGVDKVDHLNASLRWKENDPTTSLQAPVGINTFGDLFYLDLHEKFHGPHGLVAGTTGSGKSEFIITYILSLALNYHPDEVAFILIDYKGGGMAKAFETLPHTAGIITNLDGSAIKRSLVSINSELKYRQAVLNNASKQLGTRIADIYAYQKEYRNGKVKEPMPHLFIISDEFAELKSQQPEFMTELVSTARIGRSLGVHLILATQKPSGVVDDQIWSNSKFKVSLKVQDRSDSMEMLKRPDAADLTDTGRFYLLVGNNEIFEMGQSAWAGANYLPNEAVESKNVCTISIIDTNGHVMQSVKPEIERPDESNVKKQLDVVSDYISKLARDENISTRQLWLPPIDAIILLSDLHKKYQQKVTNSFMLNPLIGETDDPARQQRIPLSVPLSDEGNTVIYGMANAGKATLLTTMIYDLLCTHTAETLNMYLLDFGAETLRMFKDAPQVGDVVFINDSEKILNLLKMLLKEVSERKALFADWGGDHSSYCERSGAVVPSIVVVINNYSNFKELYFEYEDYIASLTQECAKYGIYFVFTAIGINGVSYRVTQNCGNFYTLQLNDEMDYSSVVGRTDGLFPAKHKGRGLVKIEDKIYEFQIAHVCDPKDINDSVRTLFKAMTKTPQTAFAKRIPVLPDVVNPEFFNNTGVSLKQFPIGVNRANFNAEYLQFASNFITLVGAADIDKTISVAQGIAELLSSNADIHTIVIDADGLFVPDDNKAYEYITQNLEDAIVALFELVVERHKANKREGETDFDHKVYIIPATPVLCNHLSEDSIDKLSALLERGSADYGVNIIICDNASDISAYSSQGWYKTHCNGNGIWVGDGIAGQYNFTISKHTNELRNELADDCGVIVNKGKFKIVKLLQSNLVTDEDEE